MNNLSKLTNFKLRFIVANMSTKLTPLERTKEDMREFFLNGVQAVLPRTIIERQLKITGNKLLVGDHSFPICGNVYLVGFGKAVMNMVPGVEKILGNRLKKGLISVPKGSKDTIWKVQDFENFPKLSGPVEYKEGAKNNQPDSDSLSTTNDIIELVEGLKENDTLIVLISGGGSALLCKPKPSLDLTEKQEFCRKLQQAGASIKELNVVRKKLSLIKGGGLARLAHPALVIGLILSDIVGDPIAEIASGPTVYSRKSSDEVMSILKKYELFDSLDWKIKGLVMAEEAVDENVLLDENERFKHVSNFVIGNNSIAIEAAKIEALRRGFGCIVLRNDIEGDVCDVSLAYVNVINLVCMALDECLDRESFFNIIKEDPILALSVEKINDIYNVIENSAGKGLVVIGAGEPTVVVRGNGVGGRNQQLALQFSMDWLTKIKKNPLLSKYNVVMLSGGTDGQDGPTDAAGAFGYPAIGPIIHDLRSKLRIQLQRAMVEKINRQKADEELVDRTRGALSGYEKVESNSELSEDNYDLLALKLRALEKLIPENVINNNDAYHFYSCFKKGKDLLKTGLTGTNVMDLHIISITKEECECRLDFEMDSKCSDPLDEHILNLDVAEFKKSDTVSQEINKEQKLLNLKVLDDSLAKSCCNKAEKE